MAHNRARLLDALTLLAQGQMLVRAGDSALGTTLCGHSVVDLFDTLYEQKLIVECRRSARSGVRYYRISGLGLDAFARGQRWWRGLGFWKRVRVRLFG